MHVTFVNGLIGAGKETIIRYFQEVLTNKGYKVKIILEPVELWRKSGMLERLYKGEYFEFQKFAISSRIDIMKFEEYDFVFIETNPLVDLNVYAKTTLTDEEFEQYTKHWENEMKRLPFNIEKCSNLFINVEPELSLKRIGTRSRNEESKITLDYLQKLDHAHLRLNC